MCIEDVAIDRERKTYVYFTAGTLDIPGNPNRVAVRIIAEAADTAILESAELVDQGGAFYVNMPLGITSRGNGQWLLPDDITLAKVGEILKGPLRLRALASTGAYAIETVLDLNSPSLAKYQFPKG